MKDLSIPIKTWKKNEHLIYLEVQEEDNSEFSCLDIACENKNIVLIPTDHGKEQADSISELIIDAGNTTSKCDLLPSQLLTKYIEIKEQAKNLIHQIEMSTYSEEEGHILTNNISFKELKELIE